MTSKGFKASAKAFVVEKREDAAPIAVAPAAFNVQRAASYPVGTARVLLGKNKDAAVWSMLRRGVVERHVAPDGRVYVTHESIARYLGVSPAWN